MSLHVRRFATGLVRGPNNLINLPAEILPASDLPTTEYRWAIIGWFVSNEWPMDWWFSSSGISGGFGSQLSGKVRVDAQFTGDMEAGAFIWPVQKRASVVGLMNGSIWLWAEANPQPGLLFDFPKLSGWVVAYPMHPQEWEQIENSGT